jgi:hypothetical protein
MSLRSPLLAVAFIFAAALAFIFAALGTVVLLADRDSGAPGGATPATASSGSDRVALRQQSPARGGSGEWANPIALVAQARVIFKEILGN